MLAPHRKINELCVVMTCKAAPVFCQWKKVEPMIPVNFAKEKKKEW
jgi:hypothetical protein